MLSLVGVGGFIAAILLLSCGNDGHNAHLDESAGHVSHSVSVSSKVGLDTVELNHGSRWKMDDHTRSLFSEMEALFLNADRQSLESEGLRKAGSNLQLLVGDLIQGCTMTGAAHAQLHTYLAGYLPAVAALSKSGRIEDARKVTHYLENYDEYFE